jgi:hypothetical protein
MVLDSFDRTFSDRYVVLRSERTYSPGLVE